MKLNKFAAVIKQHRKNLGISQTELASAARLAQPTIGNFEKGTFNLSDESLFRVWEALTILAKKRAAAADKLLSELVKKREAADKPLSEFGAK